ncbi:MAG: MotA/TolQ/ExbB proton channel family protein [Candidatus Krumholzibacteriia bacterium]
MFGDLSLFDVFIASPTMLVLVACSIVTVGFAIERTLYFNASRTDVRRFMTELTNRMKADPRSALDFCTKQRSPVGRVMAQGITHVGRPREELAQRLNTAIDMEQVEMERNLGVLGTMSNIAPLLGLLGTVIGIIRAFADIARTGSGGGAVVAMGVSEALLTTAAGIIVAVIATVFFNAFVRRIRIRVAQLEDAREAFFTLWAQFHRRARAAAPAATAAAGRSAAAAPQQAEPVAALR